MSDLENGILHAPQYLENTESTLSIEEQNTEVSGEDLNFFDDPEAYLKWFDSAESTETDYTEDDLEDGTIISSTGEVATDVQISKSITAKSISLLIIILVVITIAIALLVKFKYKNKVRLTGSGGDTDEE